MIKPEELRIGNWFTKDGEYHNVGHIQKNFYNICVNNYGPENIDPIPLTPEILEACGFERIHGLFKLGDFVINPYNGYYFEWAKKTPTTGRPATEFNYLHELQNLYFSLTGKELEVKLPQLA